MSGWLAALVMVIEIRAAGDCPGAAEIARRLEPLLDSETATRTLDVATIQHASDRALRVSLDDANGRPLGERRFPHAGTCGDQAETIAVTLAIWEAQIHPEIALRLDRLSLAARPVVPSPTRSASPEPIAARPVIARASPIALSLGAAVAGDWQSGSWAPAARAELAVGRLDSRWRGRLAAIGVGRHTVDVPPGQASFWRVSVGLGAERDLWIGRDSALVMGVAAVAGMVSISGSGYAVNQTSRSTSAGAEAELRGVWKRGAFRPWVGAFLTAWLRRQSLDLQGAALSVDLPRLAPTLALGADFIW